MNDAHVLVLHGSPGSGKTTVARAVAELLREAGVAHAVIDIDELSIIHPYAGPDFGLGNLAALWPRYRAAVPGLKLVLPTVVADEEALGLLQAAVPCSTFQVCELTAPVEVLTARVAAREPNDFWVRVVLRYVDLHHQRTDLDRIRDFAVSTHDRQVDASAREVIEKAGWS